MLDSSQGRRSIRKMAAYAAVAAGTLLLAVALLLPSNKPAVPGWETVNGEVGARLVTTPDDLGQTGEQAGRSASINTAPIPSSQPSATTPNFSTSSPEPSHNSSAPAASPSPEPLRIADQAGKLDLNSATLAELDELPGIGPAKAKAIADYRDKRGKFKSVDELSSIKGIGTKLMEKIRPLVFVRE
ncbi:ComEA family DNA-binding protein [Cohnella faecalis]|uniref:Helix-hairpin-helix domain-containing protein n=1 Tax=Cohnella faecalis TaxID=2315694 RepID=A0A398CNU2_9BACL|nr:helix-hairpin-helix domain-containing protein [Cohnella faecalis]RIE04165.1 helix-hairpin-helix domain-containing protein [Cohnella faecalis]